jgi:glutamate-1-semialdehyde aminotransferase
MATLDELERPGCYERLLGATAGLADRIGRALDAAGAHATCQVAGSGFTVYFGTRSVRDYRDLAGSLTPGVEALNDALRRHLRDHGVFLQRRAGTNRCFVSAAHGPAELDHVGAAFEAFIDQHQEQLA